MATTEDVIILKVGTDQAVKSVGDLKNNIKELKKQLEGYREETGEVDEQGKKVYKTIEGLTIGSEEYKQVLEELKINQNALRDAMYATTASMEDVSAAAMGASESYNSLVHQMAALKEEWRATNDEARRNELGTQIGEINQKLKDMDASVGNYQRNVGNYSSALEGLEKGFLATAGGAGAIINPVKNVTMGFKALSATPVIGILGLLANVLMKVMDGLSSSEGNMRAVTEAFSIFSGVGDLVTKVLQGLAKGVTALGNGLTWLMEKLGLVSEEAKKRQQIARDETKLLEQQRENIYKNADAELELAKLKNQAADKSKYTAEERLALLEQAAKIEEDNAKRALEAAQLEYNIIKEKNSLTESSTEDLKKEADAYAQLVKAETNYYNKTKELTSQISEAKNTARTEQLNAAKALSDAEIKLLEAELLSVKSASSERLQIEKDILDKQYQQQVENAKATIKNKEILNKTLLALEKTHNAEERKLIEDHALSVLDAERTKMENKMNIYTAGTKEYMKAQMELRKWELDNLRQGTDETNDEFLGRRLAAQREYAQSVQEYNNKIVESGRLAYENIVNYAARGSEAQLEAIVNLKQYELDNLTQQNGESDQEFYARQLAARQEYNDAVKDLVDRQTEDERLVLENKMNAEREGSIAHFQAKLNLKKFELDTLHQLEGESDQEFYARQLAAQKDYNEAVKGLSDRQTEDERLVLENKMNSEREGSLAQLQAKIELKKYELDTLHQLEGESDAEFKARQLQKEKEYTEAKRALAAEQIALAQNVASGVSGLLSSIADIYESDTEASEKELKKAKNLRIAGATIDMLSGVVTAISTAMSLGPIAGPIMGAINSAAVIAAGVANINKIKSQSTSKDGGGGSASASVPAAVSAPATSTNIPTIRTATSASEEDRLNRMASPQKVYILQSDIEAAGSQSKVQIEEASF